MLIHHDEFHIEKYVHNQHHQTYTYNIINTNKDVIILKVLKRRLTVYFSQNQLEINNAFDYLKERKNLILKLFMYISA